MSALLHPDAAAARFGGAPAAARGDAERRLGAGAFGAVRAARDTSLNSGGEACALKAVRVPRLEYDRDEGAGGDKARNVPDQVRSSKHTRAKAHHGYARWCMLRRALRCAPWRSGHRPGVANGVW